MKKILALILSLVMVFGLAACGASTETPATTPTESGTTTGSDSTVEPIVLKFSDCHNPTATNHLAFQKMAEVVKEATNGASQEAIQMNTLDMAVTNLAVIGSVIPEFGAVGGPFLFESDEHIQKAMEGELGQYYADKAAEKGLNICGYLYTGFRHCFTSKPINTVDDFKGLKIRTMENPVDVGIFNAIGAQATPMAYSELFTAIQQGTVDGGENTIANYLSDGFSEVAPYLTLSGHTYNICIILISNEAIEKIPADMRDAFFAACKDGIAQASAMVLQANEDAIETLKANGATITDIDRTALYELCKPLYEEFANDRIPTELVEMVNAAK